MLPHDGCVVVSGRMGYECQEFKTVYNYIIWDVKVILGALLKQAGIYIGKQSQREKRKWMIVLATTANVSFYTLWEKQ